MQIWSVNIIDPSLGAVHVGDSLRVITHILKLYITVLVYRQPNSSGLHWMIMFPVTWKDLNKLL